MRLLAVSGSLRAASTNAAVLRACTRLVPDNCTLEIFGDVGRLPIFNPDNEGILTPLGVAAWIDAVARADGLIVACPEYAHGIPGGMKNALDWLVSQDVPVGKPAMLIHASTRSIHARNALREVMHTMSFQVIDLEPEVQLLGKAPADVRAILSENIAQTRLRGGLAALVAFIGASGQSRRA